MNEDRCKHCDLPFGDEERVDAHPLVRSWQLWTRDKGPPMQWSTVVEAIREDQPGKHTEITCTPIDWRGRAFAGEEERDEARAYARVLAHAYTHDSRPPSEVVSAALAYPVRPKTIDCDEAEMGISALLDDKLSHDEKRQLVEHFRRCLSCWETFLSLVIEGVDGPLRRA